VRTYPRPGSRPRPSKSRAPSGNVAGDRANSRERGRRSKQGAGEVADRLRVFAHPEDHPAKGLRRSERCSGTVMQNFKQCRTMPKTRHSRPSNERVKRLRAMALAILLFAETATCFQVSFARAPGQQPNPSQECIKRASPIRLGERISSVAPNLSHRLRHP
jgi:hypothetical protein